MKRLILLFVLFNSLNLVHPAIKSDSISKEPSVELDNVHPKAGKVYFRLQEHNFNKIQRWRNIILTKIFNKQTGRKEIYSFINPSDSVFISLIHQEDMGHVYGFTYIFKPNIPDGKYRVYNDEKLLKQVIFKNHMRNGLSIEYYDNGDSMQILYNNDAITGNVITYYSNGNIKAKQFFDGKLHFRFNYDINRQLLRNEIFYNNQLYRYEVFNKDRSLKEGHIYINFKDHKDSIFDGTKLNGIHRYLLGDSVLSVHYRNDHIINYKWINKNKCPGVSWAKYRINPSVLEGTGGLVLLSESDKGEIYNPLNLLILRSSNWIFTDNKYELNSEQALRKLFVKEATSDSSDSSGITVNISTEIVFSDFGILCYKIRSDARGRDLGSPYIEYLNIDIARTKLIHTYDVIDSAKYSRFNAFLFTYENSHKRELVRKYKKVLSEKVADEIADNDTFETREYTLQKVSIIRNQKAVIIFLQENGIEIEVQVRDKNFKRHKEGNKYTSSLFIPYHLIKPYFNDRSPLYNTMVKISNSSRKIAKP